MFDLTLIAAEEIIDYEKLKKYFLQKRTWRRSGHVDVRKANKADAGNTRRSVVGTSPSPRRCVGKCSYREHTAENETRSAHVLRMHGNQNQARDLPGTY